MWDSFLDYFGKYKTLVSSVLISVAIFASLLTLCGCCFIPCIRALLQRTIDRAIGPLQHQYMALQQRDFDMPDSAHKDVSLI